MNLRNELYECIRAVSYAAPEEVFSQNRQRENVRMRQVICLYLRTNTDMSHHDIGKLLKRKHSSIVCATNKAMWDYNYDKHFKETYDAFNAKMEQLNKIR